MKINKLVVFGESQRGSSQNKNDDRFLTKALDGENYLLAVSDGMGGHPAGDVAAEDIMSCLDSIDSKVVDKSVELASAVNQADAKIRNRVKKVPIIEGMGATLTAAIISSERAWWVHIGDSRMYLMRDGILQQVTRDHTFLQDLIDSGDISLGEAMSHPMAHVLDQCVGCINAGVDYGSFAVSPGDILLLCTDGLHRMVPDSKIADILSSEKRISNCVERLFKTSIQAGSFDDTTIVIAYITGL